MYVTKIERDSNGAIRLLNSEGELIKGFVRPPGITQVGPNGTFIQARVLGGHDGYTFPASEVKELVAEGNTIPVPETANALYSTLVQNVFYPYCCPSGGSTPGVALEIKQDDQILQAERFFSKKEAFLIIDLTFDQQGNWFGFPFTLFALELENFSLPNDVFNTNLAINTKEEFANELNRIQNIYEFIPITDDIYRVNSVSRPVEAVRTFLFDTDNSTVEISAQDFFNPAPTISNLDCILEEVKPLDTLLQTLIDELQTANLYAMGPTHTTSPMPEPTQAGTIGTVYMIRTLRNNANIPLRLTIKAIDAKIVTNDDSNVVIYLNPIIANDGSITYDDIDLGLQEGSISAPNPSTPQTRIPGGQNEQLIYAVSERRNTSKTLENVNKQVTLQPNDVLFMGATSFSTGLQIRGILNFVIEQIL